MINGYLKPAGFGVDELQEKRSRFIGQVVPVGSEEEALAHIRDIRSRQAGARHNPYAYMLREGAYARYSDDGEPQGTAGLPILDVFRREGVADFCCVVTRFFGGILLGAPGLTRAYAKAAKLGLAAAGVQEMRLLREIALQIPYRLLDALRLELNRAGGAEQEARYGADVYLRALIRPEDADAFSERVLEISAGSVKVERLGERFTGVERSGGNRPQEKNSD